jgi:hypothetical protein
MVHRNLLLHHQTLLEAVKCTLSINITLLHTITIITAALRVVVVALSAPVLQEIDVNHL